MGGEAYGNCTHITTVLLRLLLRRPHNEGLPYVSLVMPFVCPLALLGLNFGVGMRLARPTSLTVYSFVRKSRTNYKFFHP